MCGWLFGNRLPFINKARGVQMGEEVIDRDEGEFARPGEGFGKVEADEE